MANPAVVNMGWRTINRILKDNTSGLVIKVNQDGTVNQLGALEYFINNVSNFNYLVRIELNGGSWHVAGSVGNLAVGNHAAMRTISFDAPGAEFTAQFGGDFPDLAAVTAELGSSFVDTTTEGIEATDNGDGTFTVASLATNTPPIWLSNPVVAADAVEGSPYLAEIAGDASDADGDVLVFAKVSGPEWLSVASDGVLSGMPTPNDVGVNSFTVSVSDGINTAVEATLNIEVIEAYTEYETWAMANNLHGETATPGAILQADGLTNFQKFAYGMDPNVFSFSPLGFIFQGEITLPGPPILMDFAEPGTPDDMRAVFIRRKDHAAAGLVYTILFSADLKEWTPSNASPTVVSDENSTSDHEVVSVPFPANVPVDNGGPPRPARFMRPSISME